MITGLNTPEPDRISESRHRLRQGRTQDFILTEAKTELNLEFQK